MGNKHHILIGLLLIITSILETNIYAQNTIAIDSSLMFQSEQMKLKRKGIGSIGKYQFGEFKIIKGKNSGIRQKINSEFFGNETKINSDYSFWFDMTYNDIDTIKVDAFYFENFVFDKGSWFSRTFLNWDETEEISHLSNLTAKISLTINNSLWYLTVINPAKYDPSNILYRDTEGELTNNDHHIIIKKVLIDKSGKKATIFRPTFGYEFWLDDKALAAVQLYPHKHWFIWIHHDLDDGIKNALAAAIGTLSIMIF